MVITVIALAITDYKLINWIFISLEKAQLQQEIAYTMTSLSTPSHFLITAQIFVCCKPNFKHLLKDATYTSQRLLLITQILQLESCGVYFNTASPWLAEATEATTIQQQQKEKHEKIKLMRASAWAKLNDFKLFC